MSALSNIPLNILYIVLLFVPGLVGLDLYLRFSKKLGELSRLQVLAYSICFSLGSLVVLYITTPKSFPIVTQGVDGITNVWQLVTISQLRELTLASAIVIYLIHISGAALFGGALGWLDKYYSDQDRDRREAWAFAFDEVARDGETVQVITTAGDTLEGQWTRESWTETQRELFLKDPKEVEFKDDGRDAEPLGRGMYLENKEIARVIFTEHDPDSVSYDETDPEDSGADELVDELEDKATSTGQGEIEEVVDEH